MKPNFALKLSNDGIELLHRDPSGWLSLGTVSFETDDVEAGCARLVAEARRLEPGGLRTKLVLPESQLRYATILAPGPTDEARRYQIEAEIEALTPYSADELAYDWSVEDDYALVVVCARETLAEAEQFADASGFNPVAFVAAPESGQFAGEPNFGLTRVAPAYVPAGERVQFDAEPVRVVGKSRPAPRPEAGRPASGPSQNATPETGPASGPAIAPAAEASDPATGARPAPPPTAAKPEPGLEPRPASGPVPTASRPAPSAPLGRAKVEAPPRPIEPARATPFADKPTQSPTSPIDPLAKVGNLVRRMGTRLRREQAKDAQEARAAQVAAPQVDRPTTPLPAARDAAPMRAAPAPRPAPGGAATPVAAPAPKRPAPDEGAMDAASAAAPARSAAEAPVAFASRRRPVPEVAATGKGTASGAATPGGRLAVLRAGQGNPKPGLATRLKRRLKRTQRAVMARVPGMTPPPPPGAGQRARGAAGWRAQADAPGPLVPASRPPVSERDKASEAEALTIFGARGNIQAAPSLARRGLMAAGGVLLLLVAVAVWVLYFSDENQTTRLAQGDPVAPQAMPQIAAPDQVDPAPAGRAPVALNALPDNSGVTSPTPQDVVDAGAPTDPVPVDPTDLALGSGSDAPVAATDGGQAADAPDGVLADAGAAVVAPPADPLATADPDAVADPDRLLDSLVQEALNQALPDQTPDRAGQATAEAGQALPQAGGAQADAATGAADGASDTPQVATGMTTANQRLSLPAGIEVPAVSEVAFTPPPPPPPFGAEFTFNEEGLVEATPEGALTPAGVTVFARRPAVVPAVRPAGIAPAPAEPVTPPAAPATPEPAAPAPAEAVPDDTPRADPALAGARPQPRSARVRALGEQLAPAVPEPEPEPAETQQDAAADPVEPDTAALETPPPGGVSLAGLRPQTRPTDLVPPAVAAAAAPVDAAAAAPALDDAGATPEAVAISRLPSARPSDVAERAQAALAAARARAVESTDQGGATAGASDLEDDEGETASAAAQPAIPSSASVARQATQTDAISLRDVNLIGVFGTPEDRRALVRLSSGRVVRVQVGDRLDGGQITAIGETELRYTKNGRNEVLEIGG